MQWQVGTGLDHKNGDVVRILMYNLILMVNFMCQLDRAAEYPD